MKCKRETTYKLVVRPSHTMSNLSFSVYSYHRFPRILHFFFFSPFIHRIRFRPLVYVGALVYFALLFLLPDT